MDKRFAPVLRTLCYCCLSRLLVVCCLDPELQRRKELGFSKGSTKLFWLLYVDLGLKSIIIDVYAIVGAISP